MSNCRQSSYIGVVAEIEMEWHNNVFKKAKVSNETKEIIDIMSKRQQSIKETLAAVNRTKDKRNSSYSK